MTELSAEASAEQSWLSDVSRMPETELALVVAEDSAEVCCRELLAVALDSRLFRFSPALCTCSSMLSWLNFEFSPLVVLEGVEDLWAPSEAGRRPRAFRAEA